MSRSTFLPPKMWKEGAQKEGQIGASLLYLTQGFHWGSTFYGHKKGTT